MKPSASRRSSVRPASVELGRLPTVETDRPLETAFEQADRLKQGRLARPGWPEKGNDFTGLNSEIDTAQHFYAASP